MSDNDLVPLCYFVLVSSLCFCVVAESAWQVRVDNFVDSFTTQPNDFAIMVEGLPATATDEEAILNFFKAHAIKDKSDAEIVKVVIGWDAKEYRGKMRELPPDDPKQKELQESVQKINSELMSTAPETA